MRTTFPRLLGRSLLIASLAVGAWQARRLLAIDSCLDSGGSFDYVAGVCDFTVSQPAHPAISMSLAAVSLVMFVIGAFLLMRRRAQAV